MRPNPEEILKQYPLTVRSVRLLSWKGKKGVWSVQTDRGLKVLKKSPSSKARQVFLNQAVHHLRRNGAPVPELVRANDGSDVVEYKGDCYTLSNAVQGPSPSYDSPFELRQIMQTLGRFHLASRGFQGTGQADERMHLGRWEDGYVKHLDEMRTFKDEARRSSSSFAKQYLKHADAFIQYGQDALQSIRGGAYQMWVRKVDGQKNLCHQDFAAGNLIKTSKGFYVIDMDSLTYDLPARDLRKILNKVMKKKGWSLDRTVAMLKAYHSVHPLTESEYSVLKADLLFPHLFYGISSKHFRQRAESDWGAGKTEEKLGTMIRAETSKMNVLKQWDAVVRRVMAQGSGKS